MRGILEVALPLDVADAQTHTALLESFFEFVGLFGLGLTCLGIVIHRFRRISTELEQQVADRTQEAQERALGLAHANVELNRTVGELREFNELAEGRELRMIELKMEINDMAVQLGEPIRYKVSDEDDLPFADARERAMDG